MRALALYLDEFHSSRTVGLLVGLMLLYSYILSNKPFTCRYNIASLTHISIEARHSIAYYHPALSRAIKSIREHFLSFFFSFFLSFLFFFSFLRPLYLASFKFIFFIRIVEFDSTKCIRVPCKQHCSTKWCSRRRFLNISLVLI